MKALNILFFIVCVYSIQACDSCVRKVDAISAAESIFQEENSEETLDSTRSEFNGKPLRDINDAKNTNKKNSEQATMIDRILELVEEGCNTSLNKEYLELLEVAKRRKSLQGGGFLERGWVEKNSNIKEGFRKGEYLGVLSKHEEFFQKYSNLQTLINRVSDFESSIGHNRNLFKLGKLSEKKFLEHLQDLAHYTISLFMLRALIETLDREGNLRYVKDVASQEEQKRYIRTSTAKVVDKKIERFRERIEKFVEPKLLHIGRLATLSNLVACEQPLIELPDLIGGNIDPDFFDPEENPLTYKLNLRPSSIMWTWINSKELRQGSWDSSFGFSNHVKRLPNIMSSLLLLNEEYKKLLSNIKFVLAKQSTLAEKESEVLKLFEEKKSDNRFMEIQSKGEEAIANLRMILEKRGKHNLGRKNKTICLEFVGKNRLHDNSNQIMPEDAKKLSGTIDILSNISVLMASNLRVKPALHFSKVKRIMQNNSLHDQALSRSESILNDDYWTMESLQEQKEREESEARNFSVFVTSVWISLGIFSGVFPEALPVALTLMLITALVVNHLASS